MYNWSTTTSAEPVVCPDEIFVDSCFDTQSQNSWDIYSLFVETEGDLALIIFDSHFNFDHLISILILTIL